MKIHIGKLILQKLDEKGVYKSEFARKINRSRQTVRDILNRESIDTQLLSEIGEALDVDFFELLSKKPVKDSELVKELKAALKKLNSLLDKRK
jgi:transcriptional regulator with XRE-family HTH domain